MRRRVRVERGRATRGQVSIGRARKIGDFVPGITCLTQERIGQLVLGGLVVRIRGRQFSPGDLRSHLGSLLDNEGVRADVVGLVGQGEAQRRLPVGEALPWRSVDEVNGRRQARVLRPLDDEGHPLGSVGTVESLEDRRDRGLHAERDTRKTRVSQLHQPLACHRVGIGLEGHLSAGRNANALTQTRQDLGELGSVKHRRSASTKKDGPRLTLG